MPKQLQKCLKLPPMGIRTCSIRLREALCLPIEKQSSIKDNTVTFPALSSLSFPRQSMGGH
jgi:hypothetical protein